MIVTFTDEESRMGGARAVGAGGWGVTFTVYGVAVWEKILKLDDGDSLVPLNCTLKNG